MTLPEVNTNQALDAMMKEGKKIKLPEWSTEYWYIPDNKGSYSDIKNSMGEPVTPSMIKSFSDRKDWIIL